MHNICKLSLRRPLRVVEVAVVIAVVVVAAVVGAVAINKCR